MTVGTHNIDTHPMPEDEAILYVNEPCLIDKTLYDYNCEPDDAEDNIRVYIPLDLNKSAILRRLDGVIAAYGEANEDNEFEFGRDVGQIISQVEIYDKVWSERNKLPEGTHSDEAVELIREIIARLEDIPDGCAEMFPFQQIDELTAEYLSS